MKVQIHYTLPDGTEDMITLEGTLEEIQLEAQSHLEQCGGKNPYSFIVEE
jgi:hypothetical protein